MSSRRDLRRLMETCPTLVSMGLQSLSIDGSKSHRDSQS